MNLPSFGYQATTKPQLGIFQIIFFSNIAIDTVVNYQVYVHSRNQFPENHLFDVSSSHTLYLCFRA